MVIGGGPFALAMDGGAATAWATGAPGIGCAGGGCCPGSTTWTPGCCITVTCCGPFGPATENVRLPPTCGIAGKGAPGGSEACSGIAITGAPLGRGGGVTANVRLPPSCCIAVETCWNPGAATGLAPAPACCCMIGVADATSGAVVVTCPFAPTTLLGIVIPGAGEALILRLADCGWTTTACGMP